METHNFATDASPAFINHKAADGGVWDFFGRDEEIPIR